MHRASQELVTSKDIAWFLLRVPRARVPSGNHSSSEGELFKGVLGPASSLVRLARR